MSRIPDQQPQAAHVLASAPHPPDPVWRAHDRPQPLAFSTTTRVLAVVGIVVLSLVLLVVLTYVAVSIGAGAVVGCGILALIPLGFVVGAAFWIDRWEPEPAAARWFAFLWGAGAAVAIALLIDLGTEVSHYLNGTPPSSEFFQSVVQAPLVEEGAKGLGVLILFLVLKRTFDGPVDGVVYAALVAGGFAFVENILYFGGALAEGGGGELASTFFLRGMLSPFAHVMFTSCTGLALGLAARKPGGLRTATFFVVGLVAAMFLHGLWNSAAYIAEDFLGYYLVVQLPLFALAIVLVVALRRRESRLTRRRLQDYANAGWLSAHDVTLLATGPGRRGALAWARTKPRGAVAMMKRFIRDATRLAYAREQIISGRYREQAMKDERALLAAVTADRNDLIALG